MSGRLDRSCCCSSDPPAGSGTADCCRLHGQNSTDKCTADRVTVQVSGSATSPGTGAFGCPCRGCIHTVAFNKTIVTMVRNYGSEGRPSQCNSGTGSQGYIPPRWYSGTISDSDECNYNDRSWPASGVVTDRPDSSGCSCTASTGPGCSDPPLCQCCLPQSSSDCADGDRCYACEQIKSIQTSLYCSTEDSGGSNDCLNKRFYVRVHARPGVCLDGQGCSVSTTYACGPYTPTGISSIGGGGPARSKTYCRCGSCSCNRNKCAQQNHTLIGVTWVFYSEVMSADACPPDVTKWTLFTSSGSSAWGSCSVI